MKTVRRLSELPDTGAVFIFGAGRAGCLVKDLLSVNPSLTIAGFIDNNKSGQLEGCKIYPFREFCQGHGADTEIIIASMYFPEIGKQLREHGFRRVYNAYPLYENHRFERRRTIRAAITGLLVAAFVLWMAL